MALVAVVAVQQYRSRLLLLQKGDWMSYTSDHTLLVCVVLVVAAISHTVSGNRLTFQQMGAWHAKVKHRKDNAGCATSIIYSEMSVHKRRICDAKSRLAMTPRAQPDNSTSLLQRSLRKNVSGRYVLAEFISFVCLSTITFERCKMCFEPFFFFSPPFLSDHCDL